MQGVHCPKHTAIWPQQRYQAGTACCNFAYALLCNTKQPSAGCHSQPMHVSQPRCVLVLFRQNHEHHLRLDARMSCMFQACTLLRQRSRWIGCSAACNTRQDFELCWQAASCRRLHGSDWHLERAGRHAVHDRRGCHADCTGWLTGRGCQARNLLCCLQQPLDLHHMWRSVLRCLHQACKLVHSRRAVLCCLQQARELLHPWR